MKKNLIIIVLTLLIAISLTVCYSLYRESKIQDKRYAELLQNSGKTKVVTEYIRDSIHHVVFEEKLIKDNEIEKRLALSSTYADSLEQALKLSISKINQVTKVNAQLDAQLKLVEQGDAITYQDKFLDIQFYPQTNDLFLKYDISLNIARYSKRDWLFGKRKHYIDVFPDDKRVKIKGLNSYTIQEIPPNRFAFGLQAGYGISFENNTAQLQPYVGLGINYNLFNF